MFCPKCATQNMENAHFCRACGLDISLVPTVMRARTPEPLAVVDDEEESKPKRRKDKKQPTYAKAFENLGVGLAFLIISIVVALLVPSGRFWWFWLLIPTLACFGEGIGQLFQLRKELPASSASLQEELPPARMGTELPPPRSTSEIMAPPPSVTEGTTRHLGTDKR